MLLICRPCLPLANATSMFLRLAGKLSIVQRGKRFCILLYPCFPSNNRYSLHTQHRLMRLNMPTATKERNSKVNSLLAAIQQKAPTSQPLEETAAPENNNESPSRRTARRSPVTVKRGRKGGAVQFWLHDEDRKLVRELAAWLSGQGLRPTDSLVIRSALRVAKSGGELLTAYRQAAA